MSNLGYAAISTSDTIAQGSPVRAIYVGVTGDVAVKSPYDSTAVTFKSVPVGWLTLPIAVLFVMATNTTATNMVAAYATTSAPHNT